MASNAPDTILRSHSLPEPCLPIQIQPPVVTSTAPASIVRAVSAPCDADADAELPQTFVLPDKAAWFSINHIHPMEIEAMPWITGKEQE